MSDDNKSADERFLSPREVAKIRREGVEEGLNQGRLEIIEWLENAYIKDSGRPDRGSARGEAILELARDAAAHFMPLAVRKQVKKAKKKAHR